MPRWPTAAGLGHDADDADDPLSVLDILKDEELSVCPLGGLMPSCVQSLEACIVKSPAHHMNVLSCNKLEKEHGWLP